MRTSLVGAYDRNGKNKIYRNLSYKHKKARYSSFFRRNCRLPPQARNYCVRSEHGDGSECSTNWIFRLNVVKRYSGYDDEYKQRSENTAAKE